MGKWQADVCDLEGVAVFIGYTGGGWVDSSAVWVNGRQLCMM